MKKKHNFRELIIWKKSMDFVVEMYEFTNQLPDTEKFGLISQIQRSAISLPSNIAEGSGRTSDNEFIHFLRISISSSYELETQIILTGRLFKLDTDSLLSKLAEIQNQIGAFIRKIKSDN